MNVIGCLRWTGGGRAQAFDLETLGKSDQAFTWRFQLHSNFSRTGCRCQTRSRDTWRKKFGACGRQVGGLVKAGSRHLTRSGKCYWSFRVCFHESLGEFVKNCVSLGGKVVNLL
ncbi:hypothetical protein E2C01_082519 [Portunus trituberculatus]|uniref:Uncharacterized protein n=1 Tax=Portunus trituberculatus TaxID=210409 RepID=A0A5B7J416_PORTR|nr:hypothetical protein [Portunus trituberculatus]